MVPPHFKGQAASCLIALNLASRLMLDPIMVMWKMPIVNGKPTMEGQLVIALVNATKPFNTRIHFDISGDESAHEKMACTAWAVTLDGDRIEYPLTWEAARKVGNAGKNENWVKAPRLMLMYRAATYLIRTHAPEVLMGLYTKEEMDDMIDVTPQQQTAQIIANELSNEVKANKITDVPADEKPKAETKPAPTSKPEPQKPTEPYALNFSDPDTFATEFILLVERATTAEQVIKWQEWNSTGLAALATQKPALREKVTDAMFRKNAEFAVQGEAAA